MFSECGRTMENDATKAVEVIMTVPPHFRVSDGQIVMVAKFDNGSPLGCY